MTKLIITSLLLLTVALESSAQDSISKFRYQPTRVPVGTVYHYLKTNIDGTRPEQISQYVASNSRLEVYKFHPQSPPAALVVAEMDWKIASAIKLESWQVLENGERKVVARLYYSNTDQSVEVSIPSLGRKPENVKIKYLPFHVYNFDFGSLNFAFRHLVSPTEKFVIGIADPTFKREGDLFTYRGEVDVTYVSEELRNKVICRKYRVDGAGLDNKGGFIWVNKLKGHIEDMEIELPDNPEWQSFKLKLLRTELMTQAQWDSFMKAQL
jgi:hypothetical protein